MSPVLCFVKVAHNCSLPLGISAQALTVLSPETQEKIRRLQTKGAIQQLRAREQSSESHLRRLRQQKQRIDQVNLVRNGQQENRKISQEIEQAQKESHSSSTEHVVSCERLAASEKPTTSQRNVSPAAYSTSSSSGVSTEPQQRAAQTSGVATDSLLNRPDRQW